MRVATLSRYVENNRHNVGDGVRFDSGILSVADCVSFDCGLCNPAEKGKCELPLLSRLQELIAGV